MIEHAFYCPEGDFADPAMKEWATAGGKITGCRCDALSRANAEIERLRVGIEKWNNDIERDRKEMSEWIHRAESAESTLATLRSALDLKAVAYDEVARDAVALREENERLTRDLTIISSMREGCYDAAVIAFGSIHYHGDKARTHQMLRVLMEDHEVRAALATAKTEG